MNQVELSGYRNGDVVALKYQEPGKDVATYTGTVCNNRLTKNGNRVLTLHRTVEVDGHLLDQFNSFRADRMVYISTPLN
jgi:hypothetical protein